MRTHLVIPILITVLLSSCAKREYVPAPSRDFTFTVEAVDAIRTFGQESSVYPEVVVTITDGNQGDYTLEFWLDGDKGAVQKMTKLWPGVPRHIPVFGKKDWGGTRVNGRIYRSDRFGATKDFETEVFVRSGDINDISGTMLGVKTKNATMNYSIMPGEVVTVYRWDEFKINFAPAPSNGIYLTEAISDNPNILEVKFCTDTIKSGEKDYAKALAQVFMKNAGRVNLAFSVFNGGQKTTVIQPFEVVEDLSVIDKAVILSSAHLQCAGSTNSWRAYYPAEFVAEFSSANPEVAHNYSLSIDGVVVAGISGATILDRKVSIPLDWEAVATTEGLVLSEGEHEFSFSVARCDGMDEDAVTGKFVVKDTGLGIQKAEFKYQDTAGEWQMYRPGVVMVDFSLVNMESPHRVIFSIDGTDVYTKEHVRFSEGFSPGEIATTYQLSLDWNTTAAKVDLTEGEHTFTLLVEREDGYSKASYDGTFVVVNNFFAPEIHSFDCDNSVFWYGNLHVDLNVFTHSPGDVAHAILLIDGEEFARFDEPCCSSFDYLERYEDFSTRNNEVLRKHILEEGEHVLKVVTYYESCPEWVSEEECRLTSKRPYVELVHTTGLELEIYPSGESVFSNLVVLLCPKGVDYTKYFISLYFNDGLLYSGQIQSGENHRETFWWEWYNYAPRTPGEYDISLEAYMYDDVTGEILSQITKTVKLYVTQK